MKPIVLVAATSRWFTTSRIVMALSGVGCTVDAVCPPRHPLLKTSAVRSWYAYRGLAPRISLTHAVVASKPDLILPVDDLAVRELHDLYENSVEDNRAGVMLRGLIERSLGAPEGFPVVRSRSALIDLARQEHVRAPITEVVSSADHLEDWISRNGLPTVLKANGTAGGEGVRIARSWEQAEQSFRALQAPPLLKQAMERALLHLDTKLVRAALFRRRSTVNAQAFVSGQDATSLIACWKGEVLGELHFEVLQEKHRHGPATVVRLIENSEMSAAAGKIVRRLGISGFCGFDFVIEERTGDAYLLEMNPRVTQVAHLALGPGRDLPAALYAVLTGTALKTSTSVTDQKTIALFPQEWLRSPKSPYLESAYHDVPWGEPDLIRACVRKTRSWSPFYSRKKKRVQVLVAGRLYWP